MVTQVPATWLKKFRALAAKIPLWRHPFAALRRGRWVSLRSTDLQPGGAPKRYNRARFAIGGWPVADLNTLKIDRGAPATPGRRRWIVWLVAALAVAAAVAVYLWQPRVTTVQVVSVVTAYPSQQFVILNATGYVVAQRKAAVASKATGRLEWLGVAEGSRVKANEVIARLDNKDVSAQLDQAAAAVKVAQSAIDQSDAELWEAGESLKRIRGLVAKGFISQSALDTALAREIRARGAVSGAHSSLAQAKAGQQVAQVAVDYTVIRAPFEGVVLTKNANIGDIVTPFSSAADSKGAVVTMADMTTLEVEADVSEASLAKVKVGQPCEVVLDALPDTRFRGSISRMVPTVDRAKATVMTKIRFSELDPRILPEMSAKVSFLSQEITPDQQKPSLAVSPEALVERGGRTVVFTVRDGKAEEVVIARGTKLGDLVAIAGAVKAGDKVVQKPADTLRAGAAVKVESK
jgi:HlyD family secretion protein